MTPLATPALIRSKVADIVDVDQHAKVVAISASPVWPHDERLTLPGDRAAVVRPCVSVLAAHDELSRVGELADTDVLVLLTDRNSLDLGDGITARLTGQRVYTLDRWQQLTSLFRAGQVDPELVREDWAVDALLSGAPASGYRPAGGGYLSRESALAALAEFQAGLTGLDLDLTGLLQWSLDEGHVERWRSLAPDLRSGLSKWLIARGDRNESVAAVVRCFDGPYWPDAVALGLVLGALSHSDVAGQAQVPRTMLETQALDKALPPGAAAEWGRAAEGLMQRLIGRERGQPPVEDGKHTGRVLRQAEKFLTDIGAVPLAHPSEVLESALGQQVVNVGALISEIMRPPSRTRGSGSNWNGRSPGSRHMSWSRAIRNECAGPRWRCGWSGG